jgi:hypothetical protein
VKSASARLVAWLRGASTAGSDFVAQLGGVVLTPPGWRQQKKGGVTTMAEYAEYNKQGRAHRSTRVRWAASRSACCAD